MRIYVTSTSSDLEPCRSAAVDVIRELGWQPVLRDPNAGRGIDPVSACARQVAATDLLLAIVGWHAGEAPSPDLGGDGLRPWIAWEVQSAFEAARPMLVLMAGDSWRPRTSEDLAGRAVMQDFRGELYRLAVFFDRLPSDPADPPEGFRRLVREQLLETRDGAIPWLNAPDDSLVLRRGQSPKWPERPYPVLLPVSHPELLGGRERELDELRRQLTSPVPVIGLYAASGIGKSSLLSAGLVPALRSEGRSVAFERHPGEPGLASRLIGDLLQASDEGRVVEVADEDPDAFVERLCVAHRLAADSSSTSHLGPTAAPVLILDQFEDLFRLARADHARAVVGMLLAATVQRLPGLDGPPCRWLLAYREEFHGELVNWLSDVLREARAQGLEAASTLPHDLSGPERFRGLPLAPLGTPRAGARDRLQAAIKDFSAAIESPLSLRRSDGTPRYPQRFRPGGAQRLARAFARARLEHPGMPLVPELQVVLAHLLTRAGEPTDGVLWIDVPEEPAGLIDQALEQHLRRALDDVYPVALDRENQVRRSRALLALRELAEVRRQGTQGLPAELVARAIGTDGQSVLEQLATPRTRLVVLREQTGGWSYVLSHDRLAEVLIRWVDDPETAAGLGVDAELLALRRFVALQSELYEAGERQQATKRRSARSSASTPRPAAVSGSSTHRISTSARRS